MGGWGKVFWPEVYNIYCISIIIRCPFQAFTHRIKVSIVIPQNRKKAPRCLRSKSYAMFYHRSKRLRILVRFALRFVPLSAYWEHKTLDSLINQWTVSIILEFHLLAKALFLWLWILKRLSKKCKKNYLCRSKVTQALFCALRINYVFFFQPKYRNGNGESPGKFK